jgi:carbon-monoxide dehydrogenase medium subunit
MHDFEFLRPRTIAEAVDAVALGAGRPLAGGQTLIPSMKMRLARFDRVVSLSAIESLRGVRAEGDALRIGAMTTHAAVAAAAGAAFPALAQLAAGIGDPAVRNRGTIGGSLANNDPAACYPAAVLGTGATVITDRREIAADAFFRGMFETALAEDEIITAVRFPIPRAAAYAKFRQPASRFAMVGVFVARFDAGVRLAVTGASERGVFRWAEAEAALQRAFTPDALAGMAPDAEGMIGDLHAGPGYRAHLVGVMARRAVAAALAAG